MKFVVKLALLIALVESSACQAQPVVRTLSGPVRGANRTTETGREYFSFQGIPYAQPPEGEFRFTEPRPVIPWTETRDATREGPSFWGMGDLGFPDGSFDALHVNIFTNNLNPAQAYPVMVFVHGGNYIAGSASTSLYNPENLVEKDVVVVTIQYRLGPFGFLALDDETLNVPGNAGMKDQRMAMQWIRANIALFGGDANRTLAFGHSAGGGSVHFMMLSPSCSGLFQRAYVTGSNALQNINYTPRRNWAEQLASVLGFNSTNEREVLNFLQTADPAQVVLGQYELFDIENVVVKGFGNMFGPTRERFITDGVFFGNDISSYFADAWGNEIPFIVGATSMEGLEVAIYVREPEFFGPNLLDIFANFENAIPREAGIERNTDQSRYYARKIQNNYYPVLAPTATNIDGILLMSADMDQWFAIHRSVRHRLRAGQRAPTYVMRFDADTELSVFNRMMGDMFPHMAVYREPMHGDEVAHFFSNAYSPPRNDLSYEALQILELMTTSLANFAATGNPSIGSMNITWNPVTDQYKLLYGLNVRENRTEMMILPESDRMEVFDEMMGGAGAMSFWLVKIFAFLWLCKSMS